MVLLTIISYAVLAPISFICQIVLVYGFLRVKKMKKHPEVMIFWQCISQIILDLHWITGIPYINNSLSIVCQFVGAFFAYFYILSWNYMLCLSLEILKKIRNPLNCKYKKRIIVYHILCHLSCFIMFCILILVKNNNGRSLIGTCFIQNASIYELIIFLPVVIHFPICWYICFYTAWASRTNVYAKHLKHHNYVVFTFSICWGINSVTHGLNYSGFNLGYIAILDDLSMIFGGASGFFMFLARISQKGILKKILRSFYKDANFFRNSNYRSLANSNLKSIMNPEQALFSQLNFSGDYSMLFDNMTCTAALDILVGFCKYFSYCIGSENDIKYIKNEKSYKLQFNLYPDTNKNIYIKHYLPEYFEIIMQQSGIGYRDFINSFNIKDNIKEIENRCKSVGGKSEAFFYFTKDNQFIIKSVNSEELDILKSMAKDYSIRISENNRSYLARVFGVFKISINSSHPIILIIMENLSRFFTSPLSFDLKGSSHERRSTYTSYINYMIMPRGKVYKDIDFENTFGKIDIENNEGPEILNSLELDTKLLEKYEIMDYSMLLLLEEANNCRNSLLHSKNCFRSGELIGNLGIIDFLQNYSARKRIETTLNTFKNDKKSNYSCIPPDMYRDRFLQLAKDIFVCDGLEIVKG
ncbi:hypothetical protein SteCoe_29780 [Stentor coeruleus]|uniref:PIPK domain-containing protein n=1 Tax=Stentor coeruleus TaxID=5963 RepID=A0A1R2B563_9CILI|nr:hypothetical protein SteCoe_29780 [Stentor coeruleus]